MKKIGAISTTVILLASAVASCAAQAVPAGQQASPAVHRDLNGCVNCSVASIPTFPQWCAIIMGLALIGLATFLMRRSKASTTV